mgnify:CR=1 FL=1
MAEEKISIIELDIKQEDVVAKLAELTKSMQALKDTTGLTAEEIEINKAQLKALGQEYQNNQKVLVNLTNSGKEELGTLQKLALSNKTLRAEQQKLNLETKEGQKRNQEIIKEIDKNTVSIRNNSDSMVQQKMNIGNYKSALDGLPGPLGGIVNNIKSMTKAAYAFIATPFGALLAVIAGAVMLVVKAFKTFDPVIEKIEQGVAALTGAFTWLKESVIALVTGQGKLTQSMVEAARAAIDLKKSEQDLENMNNLLIESEAKSKRQIDELLLQSKDRTKTEKDRIALIDEVLKIEENAYNEKKSIAEKERQIVLDKIAVGRGLTEQEKTNLNEQGVAYAILLQQKKGISDEEIKMLAEANANIETVLNESVMIREKAINRQNVIIEKQLEEDKKKADERAKAEIEATNKIIENYKLLKEERDSIENALEELDKAFFENMGASSEDSKAKNKETVDTITAYNIEQALINAENLRAVQESAIENEFELKQFQLNEDRKAELEAAEKTGADVLLINHKYANYQKILDNEVATAKLQVAGNIAGNLAELFGEQTRIGKLAAVAQATINTYLGATAAFAQTPGGIIIKSIAAGAAIIAGIKSVKKILSVKSGLPKDSSGGAVPSADSNYSVPAPPQQQQSAAQLSFAGSDVLQSRATASGNLENAMINALKKVPMQPVLVTDKVTAKQNNANLVNQVALA